MKRFRVGVIGVGFIGAVHIEQLRRLGNVDVVAVAVHSRPQEKADKLCVPKGYSDYREMIDKENLDCVHICTPNNTHYEMAMYALEHGVNVVCEKPMTTTVEEAAKLRAFADIGSHWIDLVEFITGLRVTEVLADFEIFHKTRKKPLKAIETYSGMALRPEDYAEVPISTEDYATVLFHMENGAHACCNISQVYAGRKNQMIVSVAGSKCAMHWDSENSNALWIGRRDTLNGEQVKDPSILDAGTQSVISYPGGHVEGFPDTFKQNFKQIYARMAGDEGPWDYATFADGEREMVLCDAIVKSARERRWLKVGE